MENLELRYAFNTAIVKVDFLKDTGSITINDEKDMTGNASEIRARMRELQDAGYKLHS
jgi:hypothetical protein